MKSNDSATIYRFTVGGQMRLGAGVAVGCPRCGTDRGISFAATVHDRSVFAKCPAGHEWDEPRITGRDLADVAKRHGI